MLKPPPLQPQCERRPRALSGSAEASAKGFRDEKFKCSCGRPRLAQQRPVLIAARYISVDPYMRIEQSKLDTWEAPHPLGAVQGSAVVGQVVQSNADELAVGDWTLSSSGWQNRMVRIVRSRTRDDAAMFATAPAR